MNETKIEFDLVVAGATPAGIMSAIAAARMGTSAALVEYHAHLGGMSTSGLGKSDVENKEALAGIFKEFTHRVHLYYIGKYGTGSKNEKLCKHGYYYEPSVAEAIFNEMVAEEKNITTFLSHQIEDAVVASGSVVECVFRNRHNQELLTLKANVFVDATYEGDLYARAGASYRLGREDKNEFDEPHAGKIFFDHDDQVFLPGSTGEGDDSLPAYTYRLCLTDDPANSFVMKEPPRGYNRENYLNYLGDLKEGRLAGPKVFKEGHGYYPAHFDTMLRVFSFAEIPNRKYDVNINPRPLAFPFPEENREYVEADWVKRESAFQRHRELVLGLLYFVQNDPEVPEEQRRVANQYHLPLDEFVDNDHFPWQLYVREARRLKGKYTLTENDLHPTADTSRSAIFHDSILCGEFPIDSFPVTRQPSVDKKVLEGYICMLEIAPYQIPLRVLLPEAIGGLIVPVAASTTHVAYSTIRMEPLWMCLGQVAGILAHLSIERQIAPESVPIHILQKLLLEDHQLLTYFHDLDPADKAFQAAQFWGTKGFFHTYYAHLRKPMTANELKRWLEVFRVQQQEHYRVMPPEIENGDQVLSISDFKQVLRWLVADYELQNIHGTNTMHDEFQGKDWLYDSRSDDLPLLRGEACLAFFHLYFLTKLPEENKSQETK